MWNCIRACRLTANEMFGLPLCESGFCPMLRLLDGPEHCVSLGGLVEAGGPILGDRVRRAVGAGDEELFRLNRWHVDALASRNCNAVTVPCRWIVTSSVPSVDYIKQLCPITDTPGRPFRTFGRGRFKPNIDASRLRATTSTRSPRSLALRNEASWRSGKLGVDPNEGQDP